MSELVEPGRRRADARRSIAKVLDASVELLGRQSDASMDEIAAAAGVSRQTVYAHFPNRQALLQAVTVHVTGEVERALADLDLGGSALDAIGRWVDASWALLARYPVLLTPALVVAPGDDESERHEPLMRGLLDVIERGRRRRELDRTMPTTWYVAAIIALGHAAAQEVIAGRMAPAKAGAAFRESVLRICRPPP